MSTPVIDIPSPSSIRYPRTSSIRRNWSRTGWFALDATGDGTRGTVVHLDEIREEEEKVSGGWPFLLHVYRQEYLSFLFSCTTKERPPASPFSCTRVGMLPLPSRNAPAPGPQKDHSHTHPHSIHAPPPSLPPNPPTKNQKLKTHLTRSRSRPITIPMFVRTEHLGSLVRYLRRTFWHERIGGGDSHFGRSRRSPVRRC